AHQGYQNPLAAWALSNVSALKPKSPTAPTDWATSLQRQLQFFQWLQSAEGAIAGGAVNGWDGHYGTPPAGDPTFYGMNYDWQPEYHDPPSNNWFGFQAWSMERFAEYYYETGDPTAKALLDKWVTWAKSVTTLNADGTYSIPSTINWSGQPAGNWTSSTTSMNNTGLHVTVVNTTPDVGVTAALAKTLLFYAAKSGDTASRTLAQNLLDRMANLYTDSIGISNPETRTDYSQFNDSVSIPSGWTGTNAQGATLNSSTTFLTERPNYPKDPAFSKVQAYLNGGAAPTFNYHRFWAQADIAMANADVDILFGSSGTVTPTTTVTTTATATTTATSTPTSTPTPIITPTPTPIITPTPSPTSTVTGGNGVTATGAVASSSPWFSEEDVKFGNTSPVTALSITITVQKTAGVSYNGMYATTGNLAMTHVDNGSTITYTFTLNSGQSISPGTNYLAAAQFGGNGTAHATTGDLWSITTTSGGITNTVNGHF
ncbi:MAG TPA: glycoside hydrolase family 48 protein, partial [Ktedonobacteraceae bacterium]|nr:glycoside hydrolase family 48 protein [Ktedonobacteraceae bacterium]